jgi:hypothetical protein
VRETREEPSASHVLPDFDSGVAAVTAWACAIGPGAGAAPTCSVAPGDARAAVTPRGGNGQRSPKRSWRPSSRIVRLPQPYPQSHRRRDSHRGRSVEPVLLASRTASRRTRMRLPQRRSSARTARPNFQQINRAAPMAVKTSPIRNRGRRRTTNSKAYERSNGQKARKDGSVLSVHQDGVTRHGQKSHSCAVREDVTVLVYCNPRQKTKDQFYTVRSEELVARPFRRMALGQPALQEESDKPARPDQSDDDQRSGQRTHERPPPERGSRRRATRPFPVRRLIR